MASTGQGIIGNNMFAYCVNNPNNYTDHSGNLPSSRSIVNPNAMLYKGGSHTYHISDKERKEKELQEQGRKFFNESEEAVIHAKHFAFYKGIPVIKVPGDSAFSFGMIFFGSDIDSKNLVRHEYGHTQQLAELGVEIYAYGVVVPSVTCFWLTKIDVIPDNMYFSLPWEYIANMYGEVSGNYYPWADETAKNYWSVMELISHFF